MSNRGQEHAAADSSQHHAAASSKASCQQQGLSQRPKAEGLGGKGGTKVCVPCSLAVNLALRTAKEARERGTVSSSRKHNCPYCKCAECKKVWDRNRGEAVVDRMQLAGTLKSGHHPPHQNT